MKRMMGLMIYGGILFGLSAGGAWFLHSKHQQELQTVKDEHAPNPDDLLVPSTTQQPNVASPEIPKDQQDDLLNRVPVRPEAITAEEIVRHGIKLKNRDKAIREREEALQRVEAQYTLMLNDIQGEQSEIEGLMVQAREQRRAADEILRQANLKHQEASSMLEAAKTQNNETRSMRDTMEREQSGSALPKIPQPTAEQAAISGPSAADRDVNYKDLTKMMQDMSPEIGAGILSEFMDNGKSQIALELISRLDKSKAAEILDKMSEGDDGTNKVTELMEKFTEMPHTAQAGQKKRKR